MTLIYPNYRFNAVSNDGEYTFAFDDWNTTENIAAVIKSVEQGSYDVFASAGVQKALTLA